LVITDHGDGTWSAYSPLDDVITMLDVDLFQIVSDTATYLDAETYTIESSEKNEDDIWLP
jgi:arginine deiminase